MKQFHPQITAKFDETVHWTLYIVFAITTFISSLGPHFLMSCLFHRYIQVHRRFSFRLTISAHPIKSQPILVVSDEDYDYLRQHPNHRIREKGLIFRRRDLNLPNPFLALQQLLLIQRILNLHLVQSQSNRMFRPPVILK